MRICKKCKRRVLRQRGETGKTNSFYCPNCFQTLDSFHTEKVSLDLRDVCAGDGYTGIRKKNGYRHMTVLFNDRAFEDYWTEPYLVHLKLCTDKTAREIATELIRIGQEIYDEKQMDTSTAGIKEIMEQYRQTHPELEYFVFGCPVVPFGEDVTHYGIL